MLSSQSVAGTATAGASTRPVRANRPTRIALGYLVLSAVITTLYYAYPGHHLQLWTPLGLLSAAAVVAGIRIHRPTHSLVWYLLAAATLSLILGDTTYNVLTEIIGQVNPYPSAADPIYLLTYPLFAAGLLLLIRARSAHRDRGGFLDASIATTGAGLLVWVYLVRPYFEDDALSGLQRLVSVAYPLGDVLVLSLLARLIISGGLRIRSVQLLTVGALGLLVADILYALSQLRLNWNMGGLTDLGWIIFYTCWGAAALDPSMRQVTERVQMRSSEVRTRRIAVLGAFGLIAPAVLLADVLATDGENAVAVGVFSALLFGLVIVRLGGIVRVHSQSVARERALRSASEWLVGAQSEEDIFAATHAAVAALTGTASAAAAVFLDEEGVCRQVTGPVSASDSEDELWGFATAGGSLSEGGMLSVTPLRYDKAVRGMLVVRTDVPMTPEVHGALATLASQEALALERTRLSASLQQRHAEAHFSRLVQNASDVILVMDRDGVVTYGRRALLRSLGLPEAGEDRNLWDRVHPDDIALARESLVAIKMHPAEDPIVIECRMRHADGLYRTFEAVYRNLLADPVIAGLVLTMRDVSHRRRLEEELKRQAFHDDLTGLANRALLQERANTALTRRGQGLVAMVLLDLDDFKEINDTHGHAAGDDVLKTVARRVSLAMRPGDIAARLGGDEFAMLIKNLPDARTADAVAGRILQAFVTPFVVNDEMVFMNASAGVVVAGPDESDLDLPELLMRADLALYAAKEAGKGQFRRYEPDLRTVMLERVSRRKELKRAVERDEFFLLYQPVVLVETGEIVGTEALVRWRHPRGSVVGPNDFIPLAEETGLIVELGRWVLDAACAQAKVWEEAGGGDLRMCVNVSGRQFTEPAFVSEVREALERHALAPGTLVLELTESMLFHEGSAISDRLTELRSLGVKIAIDDFGTGYSSLGYLQQFDIDILKVDKCFIAGLGRDSDVSGALAKAIVSMAHLMHLEVVAEGIERPDQRDELWSLGCGLGQGELYARPLEAHKITGLITGAIPLGGPVQAARGELARLRPPAPPLVHAASWSDPELASTSPPS